MPCRSHSRRLPSEVPSLSGQRESVPSSFVFVSERGTPFTTTGFARMIERAAVGAGLELKTHPHMLRHACGYALANKGHDTRQFRTDSVIARSRVRQFIRVGAAALIYIP